MDGPSNAMDGISVTSLERTPFTGPDSVGGTHPAPSEGLAEAVVNNELEPANETVYRAMDDVVYEHGTAQPVTRSRPISISETDDEREESVRATSGSDIENVENMSPGSSMGTIHGDWDFPSPTSLSDADDASSDIHIYTGPRTPGSLVFAIDGKSSVPRIRSSSFESPLQNFNLQGRYSQADNICTALDLDIPENANTRVFAQVFDQGVSALEVNIIQQGHGWMPSIAGREENGPSITVHSGPVENLASIQAPRLTLCGVLRRDFIPDIPEGVRPHRTWDLMAEPVHEQVKLLTAKVRYSMADFYSDEPLWKKMSRDVQVANEKFRDSYAAAVAAANYLVMGGQVIIDTMEKDPVQKLAIFERYRERWEAANERAFRTLFFLAAAFNHFTVTVELGIEEGLPPSNGVIVGNEKEDVGRCAAAALDAMAQLERVLLIQRSLFLDQYANDKNKLESFYTRLGSVLNIKPADGSDWEDIVFSHKVNEQDMKDLVWRFLIQAKNE